MHEVAMLLQPRQLCRAEATYDKVKGLRGGVSHLRQEKGKGKPKSKSSNAFVRMPHELIGCHPKTLKGENIENICFSFNVGRCNEKVYKGKCSRGVHVCCAPKCGAHHAAITCDKLPSKNGKN
jgi:hypothetical protein